MLDETLRLLERSIAHVSEQRIVESSGMKKKSVGARKWIAMFRQNRSQRCNAIHEKEENEKKNYFTVMVLLKFLWQLRVDKSRIGISYATQRNSDERKK